MTKEYFEYLEELQRKETEARLQREKMYSQMQAEYINLKRDNINQNKEISELQNKNKVADLRANLFEQENIKLKAIIAQLRNELENNINIVATAKKYLGTNPLPPDVILNRFANNETYKKREKALEDKIKELQDKLGNKSVLLSVLAEGIKEFAEEKNIEEAHTLFEHLCYILIEEKGWTDNVADLKRFFKKARKEMQKATNSTTYIKEQTVIPKVGNYKPEIQTQNMSVPLSSLDEDEQSLIEG